MKRFLFIVMICIFLVGCHMRRSNELKISLYSNGSTGYRWSYRLDRDDIVSISESYDNSGCPPKTAGCGGKQIYTIKPIKAGKVILNLEYAFVNPEKYPSKTAIYEIVVHDDLSISESHYGTYFDEEN